jgi:hypothetical protein
MIKKTEKHTVERGIAASMRGASALTGFSFRAVQAAKNGGCTAFLANGRVNCDALVEWLSEHPEILEIAGERVNRDYELALKARADRMLREHELAVQQGKYVLVEEMEKFGVEFGTAIRKIVTTIHLAAPNVVGVSVAEAEVRLKEIEDEILQQLHLLNFEFPTENKPTPDQ